MRLQSVRPKNAKQNRKNTKKSYEHVFKRTKMKKQYAIHKNGEQNTEKTQKYKRKNAKQLLFS